MDTLRERLHTNTVGGHTLTLDREGIRYTLTHFWGEDPLPAHTFDTLEEALTEMRDRAATAAHSHRHVLYRDGDDMEPDEHDLYQSRASAWFRFAHQVDQLLRGIEAPARP